MVLTRNETETIQELDFARPVAKSYFAPATEVETENPLFEVEKEYDNLTLPERKAKSSILPEFEILPDKTAVVADAPVQQKQMSLSARGKVLAVVCSLVMVLLLTLVVYNSVVLAGKNREIARLATQIELKESDIATLQRMLKGTQSEEQVKAFLTQNNSGLRKATEADKVRLALVVGDVETVSAPTNWFDKVCEFFSNLF